MNDNHTHDSTHAAMSLLRNSQAANQNGNNAASTTAPSRPGLPGSSGTTNNPFSRPAFGSSPPPRPNMVDMRPYALLPVRGRQVVYFSFKGLGDPFYRLLNHDVNADYSDTGKLIEALEKGGENVEMLKSLLDSQWEKHQLRGAVHFYTWDQRIWETLLKADDPPRRPARNTKDESDDEPDDDNTDTYRYDPQKLPVGKVKLYRALDLALVLNVLARTRSQLLITRAAPVFSANYLGRAIATDDPRIVRLAQATGCLEVF